MKAFTLALFILSDIFSGSAAAKDKSTDNLKIKVVGISASGTLTLEVANFSKKPIKIWDDWNSWGAARWRVSVVRKGELKTYFQNPDQDFTKNYPSFSEIAVGSHSTQKLDINGANWCGLSRCTLYDEHRIGDEQIHFESGDMIIVTYDVPFTNEASNMQVWYGVAEVLKTVQ